MEMVQAILKGSKNIDRMREEIYSIIRMVLGLIYSSSDWERLSVTMRGLEATLDMGDDRYKWVAAINSHGRLSVECDEYDTLPNRVAIFWLGDVDEKDKHYPAETVLKVHGSLQLFLQGIIKIVPEVGEKLEIFLEASEVQF